MTAQYSWTHIDKLERSVLLLDDTDVCYYYLKRTSGGFSASEANNRIDNFKRKAHFRNNPSVWKYKTKEIDKFTDDVCTLLAHPGFSRLLERTSDPVIVPMPTSIPKANEDYDSRLHDLCHAVATKNRRLRMESPFDVRKGVQASHLGGSRLVSTIKSDLVFDGFERIPSLVLLVDDVITTGAHYIACRDTLRSAYPDISIIGIFLAIHRSDHVDYEVVGLDR